MLYDVKLRFYYPRNIFFFIYQVFRERFYHYIGSIFTCGHSKSSTHTWFINLFFILLGQILPKIYEMPRATAKLNMFCRNNDLTLYNYINQTNITVEIISMFMYYILSLIHYILKNLRRITFLLLLPIIIILQRIIVVTHFSIMYASPAHPSPPTLVRSFIVNWCVYKCSDDFFFLVIKKIRNVCVYLKRHLYLLVPHGRRLGYNIIIILLLCVKYRFSRPTIYVHV